jgi:hypothetical protein
MSDRTQGTQPAATNQSSSTPGSVAPPRVEQDGVTPGVDQNAQNPKPGYLQVPTIAQGQPEQQQPQQATQPAEDLAAQLARERQERERLQNETRQYQAAINQVRQYAETQQQTQAQQQQIDMILAQADAMPSSEGAAYLRNQMRTLIQQQQLAAHQQIQQREQQFEQERKILAAPAYADYLMESMQIPAEAKQEILALQDPELMYRMAPQIKQRYEQFNNQLAQFQQGQQQLARSQEVNALRQNGLTAVGGQGAGASYDIEVSDDPDERAMQILAHMRERERQGLPPAVAIPRR